MQKRRYKVKEKTQEVRNLKISKKMDGETSLDTKWRNIKRNNKMGTYGCEDKLTVKMNISKNF